MIVKSIAYVRYPLPIGIVTHADLHAGRCSEKRSQLS